MARRGEFSVQPFTNPSGTTVFRVTGTKLNGERVRLNFSTKVEAVKEKQRLDLEALQPGTFKCTYLSEEQLRECERALTLLGTRSIVQAVQFFNENYREPVSRKLLTEALAEFITFKELRKRRPDTIRNLRQRVGMFAQRHPQKLVSDVLAAHVETFILRAEIDPVTAKNDFLALHNFFNWSISRGYCGTNPVKGIELPEAEDDEPPEILSLDEVRRFFENAAQFKRGKMIPFLVLSTLTAIRPKEVFRLSWDDIDLESKLVMVRKGKTRQRRMVDLSENAVAWLKPHADDRTPIKPENWRREFDCLKEMSGFLGPQTPQKFQAKERDKLKPWCQDVLRHTGISHHLAYHEHEGKTAVWAGNSPEMIHKHYKGLVKRRDSEQFWNIYPKLERGATISPPPVEVVVTERPTAEVGSRNGDCSLNSQANGHTQSNSPNSSDHTQAGNVQAAAMAGIMASSCSAGSEE